MVEIIKCISDKKSTTYLNNLFKKIYILKDKQFHGSKITIKKPVS